MSTCPTITIDNTRRTLGLLLPDDQDDAVALQIPELAEHVWTLDRPTIEHLAKSGRCDQRRVFTSAWIRNQGSHGSCNGFAGALALSRARRRVGMSKTILSGAYLYSLINGGRDQGSHLSAGMTALQQQGCATESTVAWNDIYPRKYDRQKADTEAARFRAFECYRCEDIWQLWTALALGFDCVVAVHVGRRFSDLDRAGFAGVDRGQGNHAVACDGLIWADGQLAATAYNSWGTAWGAQGRMLLGERHFEQTLDVHDFYAIRSATDDSAPEVRA